ncbi:MAG: discoidin domain-containing protein [Planctomycetota bacterium]|jgi:hypothetical protein
MYRKTILLALLGCLALSSMVSATMLHEDWYQNVADSRQAIVGFLVDLVNPVQQPDFTEVINESFYQGNGSNYVAKFSGWITVPATGEYQFHFFSDDSGMLYISQDEVMANAVEVAYIDGAAGLANFNDAESQHSRVMFLTEGQIMAVMAFFVEVRGNDHMGIAWTGPGLSSDITNPTYISDWVTHIRPTPNKAKNPVPVNDATDVPRDVILGWGSGRFAAGHDVYIGTVFDDVNDASRANPLGVLVSQNQDLNTYAPAQRLDLGTTYYWRIDEVSAPPDYTIYKGKIWKFTAEPIAYAIENITATASSQAPNKGPENTVNGSGLDASGLLHGKDDDYNMWLSGIAGPQPTWIEYEFDNVYKLFEMWVWNSNDSLEPVLGLGCKDVSIEYSANGTDYTTLGTTYEFAWAPGMPDYAHNTTVDFGNLTAKYIKLTANSNWGGIFNQYGLSEVRFFHIPVHAREPYPASGAAGVPPDVVLSWRAGREAVTHDVYVGIDEQAVIDGTAPVATVAETSYGPLALDLGETYFWRVEEVNEAETPATWQGGLWNFTTNDHIVVDDFESYNDLDPAEPASKRIFNTWIDGYGIATNGSLVGYELPPFCEQTIVHGGKQSMPLAYSNTGGAAYSEAELTLTPAQDWTAAQVRTLAVHFHGTAGNTGQLYLKINGTEVLYDGQTSNLAQAGWQAWNVDLASSGASLQNVTKLAIGIDGNGASGTLYFDDIGLYARSREFITPSAPDDTRLIGHWKFDGDTQDSSGRGNHGTSGVTPPAFVAGKVGSNAMDFRGADYVVIDGVVDDITSTHADQ